MKKIRKAKFIYDTVLSKTLPGSENIEQIFETEVEAIDAIWTDYFTQ